MSINSTQAAILGLLHDGPKTGGDLNTIAHGWISPYFNTTRSQIYRELPTLTNYGYLKAGTPGVRNSVRYKITASGKRAFQAWLKQEPSPDMLRSEAVLRVAFGGRQNGEDLEELLILMRSNNEQKVNEISEMIAAAGNDGMEHDVAALRFALMYHQMIIGWLETVELPE